MNEASQLENNGRGSAKSWITEQHGPSLGVFEALKGSEGRWWMENQG